MAVPKKKTSPSRRGMRAGGQMAAAPRVALSVCGNCGNDKRPHHVCSSCGFYAGRQVFRDAKAEVTTD